MTDALQPEPQPVVVTTGTLSGLIALVQTFGRDGLVLAMVLVVWFGIAKPEISRNAERSEVVQSMLHETHAQFKSAVKDLESVSRQQEHTAQMLQVASEHLAKAAETIHALPK